jgi:hypothetical protein
VQIQIYVKEQQIFFHAANKTRVAAVKSSYALPSLIEPYFVSVLKNA